MFLGVDAQHISCLTSSLGTGQVRDFPRISIVNATLKCDYEGKVDWRSGLDLFLCWCCWDIDFHRRPVFIIEADMVSYESIAEAKI